MKINRGFKFRIIPNKEQISLIEQTFGCCRFVYNQALDYRNNEYKLNNHRADYKETSALLTKIKRLEEYSWLNIVDSTALQSALKNLNNAFNNFFRDPEVGYPKFKSKHIYSQSYISRNNKDSIKILDDKHIQLPKLKEVRIKMHRQLPLNCKIENATISRKNNKYYVSLSCEWEVADPQNKIDIENAIGIDYSSHDFAVNSENFDMTMPHYFRKYENRLAIEQRKLSNKKLHSKNWVKQKAKVDKIQEKISNSRLDRLHWLSNRVIKNFDVVCLEDLNLQNVAQFHHLGKSTNDNGFGMFRDFLNYKAIKKGKIIQKVGKFFPSSKLCSCCGYKKVDLILSDREWTCPNCQTHHDRDFNAAVNIKKEGIRLLKESITAGTAGLAC